AFRRRLSSARRLLLIGRRKAISLPLTVSQGRERRLPGGSGIELVTARFREEAANQSEHSPHEELTEDEPEEKRERQSVEAHSAGAEHDGLRRPAEKDAEPHPVHGAPREADGVAD